MRPRLICFIVLGLLASSVLCWWPWDYNAEERKDQATLFCERLNSPQYNKEETRIAYNSYRGVAVIIEKVGYTYYHIHNVLEEEKDCAYNTYIPKTGKDCPTSHPLDNIDEERCYSQCPDPFLYRQSKCTCIAAK